MLVAGAAGVGPMWLLLTAPPGAWSLARASACSAAGGLLATQTGPNVRATLVNVTRSEPGGRRRPRARGSELRMRAPHEPTRATRAARESRFPPATRRPHS